MTQSHIPRRIIAVASLLALSAPVAHAVDGIALEVGRSSSTNADVDMARVGVQWNWARRWAVGSDWHIGGFWDLSLGYWDNKTTPALRTVNSITDLGLTPTFRLQQNKPSGFSPYLEAAIGFHLLSETSVSTQRRFSTMFQFGDHIGFGARFGDKGAFDIGYRYQHLSNAGIKRPNQGINFHQVRVQYHF